MLINSSILKKKEKKKRQRNKKNFFKSILIEIEGSKRTEIVKNSIFSQCLLVFVQSLTAENVNNWQIFKKFITDLRVHF